MSFITPIEAPDVPSITDSIRDHLPRLEQPVANYDLIFAEEFNGPYPDANEDGCHNGLATLDVRVWNRDSNICDADDLDIDGTPCVNVENGYYYYSVTSLCRGSMETIGKFSFKYGYLELQYTVNMSRYSGWTNLSLGLGEQRKPLKYNLEPYGIIIDTYEELLKYLESEINILEYVPNIRRDISHQYINYWPSVFHQAVEPRRTNLYVQYCGAGSSDNVPAKAILITPPSGCGSNSEVTVTKGLEWTPQGYRNYLRVDGIHDDFIVVPKENIEVEYKAASLSSTGEVTFGDDVAYTGDDFDQFFDGDDGFQLEQVAISHVPLSLSINGWGFPQFYENRIRTKMKIDYIRIFQPKDRYSNMEPLYQ